MVSFGIESSDSEILARARKRQDPGQSRRAVEDAKAAGLMTTGHVIVGLPGETHQTARATLKFVSDLKLDFIQFYCVVPWPGSPLYEEALEKGWLATTDWRQYEQEQSCASTMSSHSPSMGSVSITSSTKVLSQST